jgi:hypothetical protein
MRIADAVEHKERPARARPFPGRCWIEIGKGLRAGHSHDPTVQQGAGDPRELRLVDVAVGLRRAASTWQNRPTSPATASSTNSRSTRPGSRSKTARTAASPQIRTSSRSCAGRPPSD